MASEARRNRRKLIIAHEKGNPKATVMIHTIIAEGQKKQREEAAKRKFEKRFSWLYWIADQIDNFFKSK